MRHFAGIFTDTQRGTGGSRCGRFAAPMALAAVLVCALLSLNPAVALALDVTVTTNAASGPGSLAQAVADINARPEAETNTISFASSLSGQTITLDSGVYLIKQMSILNDLAASGVTISSSDIDGSLAAFFYPLSLGGSSPLTISSTGGKGLHARYTGNNESIGSIGSQVSVLGSNASTTPGATVRSYGIYGDQGLVMSGAMAGAVSSTTVAVRGDNYSAPTTAYAYGLAGLAVRAGNPNALVLSSGLSGTVTAVATISNSYYDTAYAYGLYADTAMHGGAATSTTTPLTISGSVSATATAKGSYAYGVYSGSSAYLLPLTISGSVTATSNNGTWPSGAYGVYASGPLDLLLTGSINTAIHSDIGGTTLHYSGVAIRGGAGSKVTLNPGANWGLTGDVDLGGGNSRLTLLGTGTIADYIWGITYLVVGDGTTPANWTLKPTVHSYDNLSIAANAAATINTSRAAQLYGSVVNNGALTYWTSFLQGGTIYYGAISGTGSLTVYGASGTSELMAANTYSGATTVSAGTLAAGTGGAFSPNSAFILANGDSAKLSLSGINQTIAGLSGGGTSGGEVALGSATLTVNGGGSFAGFISGTGGLTKAGAATLTLSGANTYTGATTVNAGTLQAGAADVLRTSSGVALANTAGVTLDLNNYDQTLAALSGGGLSGGNVTLGSATLTVQNALDNTYAGAISGTGGLTKADSGTLTLSGANSYSGATTVNAGRFKAGATGAFSSASAVTLADAAGATLDLNNFSQTVGGLSGGGLSGGNVTLGSASLTVNGGGSYGGVISGTGGLIKAGAGTLTLSGTNAYSGGTAINAGTLAVSSDSNLGPGALSLNGGTLENTASFASAKTVSLGASGGTFQTDAGTTLGLSGVISGTGGLIKTGSGTLVLSGANTYSGVTTVNAGTLQAGAADVLRTSSGVALANTAGATLDLSGFNQTIAGLSGGGTGGGNVSLGSATLTVQNTLDYTYAGAISGTGGLVKSGSGTLALSGVNTYTGTTAVNAGVLSVTGSLNSGSISVASGATLNFSGSLTNLTSLTNDGTITLTSALTFSDSDCTIVSTGSILAATSSAVAIQLGAGNDSVTLGPGATVRGVIDGSGGVNTLTLVGSVSLDGEVRNFQNLVKKNAGSWTISGGVDLGTGTLSVIGGTLTLEGGLTSSGASIASGAGLVFSSSSNTSYSGVISGAGSLSKAGTGTLTLSGANINTGETSVAGGTLQAGATGTLSSASAISLADSAGVTLDLNNYGQTIAGLSGGGLSGGNVTLGSAILTVQNTLDYTYAGVISGTGGLTKAGSAVLTLSGASTYTGATTVNAGTLRAGAANIFATSSGIVLANTVGAVLDLNNFSQTVAGLSGGGNSGGNVTLGSATLTVQNALDSAYAGVISGTGGLIKAGAGILTLSGANTYSGGTAINAGTLAVGSDNNLGTGGLAVNGGTLENTASFTSTKTVSLGASGGTFQTDAGTTLGLSGVISGTGGLTKTGSGTLVLSGANTYSGVTTVSSGTLRAGAANAFSGASAVTLANTAGATLDLSGFNQTIAGLTGGGSFGGNVLLGSATLTVQSAQDYTYAGVISGTGGLTKAGSGTLTLTGDNTYTGMTTISGGTLVLATATALSGASVVNLAGGSLQLNFDQTVTDLTGSGDISLGAGVLTVRSLHDTAYSGAISGTGGLTKTGAAVLTLSGANTFSGATTVYEGTLRAGATNTFSPASAVTLADTAGATMDLNGFNQTIAGLSGGGSRGGNVTLGSATLTVNGGGSYAGAISGTGGLTKTGTDTLILSGANTYTGATTVNAGALQAGATGAFSSGSAVILADTAGATMDLNGFNQTVSGLSGGGSRGGNVTLGSAALTVNGGGSYAGVISGTGGLVKTGPATLTLSGANTYTGGTAIDGGTLVVGADNNLGTGGLALDSGTLENTASFSSAKTVSLGASGGTFLTDAGTTLGLSGVISGPGGLTKAGAGTLALSGANTYAGATTVLAGTLQAGATGAFSAASAITLAAGATLDLNGFDQTIGGLSGGAVALGSATLTMQTAAASTYGGVISGPGGLIKTGSGVLTLSGASTYSGGTAINAGTLAVSSDNNLGTGALTFDGGTLENTASFACAKYVSLGASGGTFLTDAGTTLTLSGAISGPGGLTKSGDGTLVLVGTNTYSGATTVNAGTLAAGVANVFSVDSAITLATGATLDLNNFNQTIGGLSGGNVALGSATLTMQTALAATYGGVISGTGGLIKTGAGTLTLTGLNTYTGATAINAGTLAIGADNTLGSGALAMNGGGLQSTASFASARNISLGSSGGSFSPDASTTLTLSGVISGTGSLTMNGLGTLALTGANTYTGGTVLNAGIVDAASWASIGGTGNPLTFGGGTLRIGGVNALQIGMDVGTGIVFNTGPGTLTVPGILTGAGTVTKIGTGTLVLTGTNTYAGGTILNGGTVSIGSGANLGTGPITFNGCTVQFSTTTTLDNAIVLNSSDGTFDTNGFSATLSGVISGSGALIKTGSGILNVRGSNTYTGGASFNGGVINIVSDANLGDPSGPLFFNGGALQLGADVISARSVTLNAGGGTFDTNGYSLTLNGNVGGVGSLSKTGAGILYLRGANTYSGPTTIRGGAVNILSDANLGSLSGPVVFDGGALQAGAAFATSRNLTVNSGGGGLDNAGHDVALSGAFSGPGVFIFTGTGATTLAGDGSGYTGQALLNAGNLVVSATGVLGGSLTTNPGTTVLGYGTLGNLTNNGLVSPGGSIGTLNVAGNYVQGATAVYIDEIDPSGRGDLLRVGGSAQLNGGLLSVKAPIAYYSTLALWPTITAAGGHSGAFGSVAQDFPSRVLYFLPVYTANATLLTAWRIPYAAFSANGRAASAGWGLYKGTFNATGAFASTVLGFDLADPTAMGGSLNQLHPEPYDAFTQSGFDSGRLFTASIQGRLNGLRTGDTQAAFASPFDVAPSQALAFNEQTRGAPLAAQVDRDAKIGVYLQSFGMTGKQGSTGGRTAYGFNAWGTAGGVDLGITKNAVAGVFGGYANRSLALSAPASDNGRAETVSLGGYGSYFTDRWFVEGSLRAGLDSYHARRTVASPAGSTKASAAWGGWNLFANAGAGYDWRAKGFVLTPLVSAEYARLSQDGYEESGGGTLGLTVRPRSDASLQTSLGAKISRPMEFGWGSLTPEVRMAWGHEWFNAGRDIVANFQGSESTRFTTRTVSPASDWAAVSAGVTVRCADRLSVTARVSTDLFRQAYRSMAGSLGIRYSF